MHEWMRLVRSCEKTGQARALAPRVLATALTAYCGRDRALRGALLERLPAESARLRRHRRAWRLLGDAALRRSLGEAGLRDVEAGYTYPVQAARWAAFLRRVAAAGVSA